MQCKNCKVQGVSSESQYCRPVQYITVLYSTTTVQYLYCRHTVEYTNVLYNTATVQYQYCCRPVQYSLQSRVSGRPERTTQLVGGVGTSYGPSTLWKYTGFPEQLGLQCICLADPGKARACSTNSLVIHLFIHSFIKSAFSSHSFTARPRPNG